jgi:hypothetical protein
MEDRLRSMLVHFRELSPARRRLVLASCLLGAFFLLFLLSANRDAKPVHQPGLVAPDSTIQSHEALPPDGLRSLVDKVKEAPTVAPLRSDLYGVGSPDSASLLREPRVAYSAELSIATKEFVRSRSSLEEILERHRGYVAKLRMVGQPLGSVLSAMLRIPSSEFGPALTELKSVGRVEHEEESADEITQQHNDLEARLMNAQNTEGRLQQLLQKRTGKSNELGPVEHQISLLRGEIERMEAERYAYGSRVVFANVFFSMREERTPPVETVGAQLRNAAVSGLSDAFNSLSSILLFLASRGPLLFLWTVVLYFPARFLWHRRLQWVSREAESLKS